MKFTKNTKYSYASKVGTHLNKVANNLRMAKLFSSTHKENSLSVFNEPQKLWLCHCISLRAHGTLPELKRKIDFEDFNLIVT